NKNSNPDFFSKSQVHYSATCDPVWSQYFPLLPLLTAVIVTRRFLKVIVIPFD
ncbi:hypothetical protein SERLA73DRAFT_182347, partial [Serpula lacrymans var. lacrymans S7.3]